MTRGNERVLVVDDAEAIRTLFTKGLEKIGYHCVSVGSAEDADKALRVDEFDIMLLDIDLPGKSGLNILSEFVWRYPEMAIVMVTGQEQLETAVLAMREGAYDYVTKPVTLALLSLRIGKVLERRAILLEEKAYHLGNEACDLEQLESSSRENPGCAVEAGGTPQDEDYEVEGSGDFTVVASEFITTGVSTLDEKLGGGLPCGSLTLVEGSPSAGKSVLCQHLTYGALMAGRDVAWFSSEITLKRLLTRMYFLGLDPSDAPLGVNLTVEPLPDPLPDDDRDIILPGLLETMQSLPDKVELIIIDAITNLASYSGERSILHFFSACKRMCAAGKTVILVAHSSTFEEGLSVRLRALCDGWLSLHVESVRDLMKSLEVRKALNAEASTGNVILFDVQSNMGIRIDPYSHARV